MRKFALISVIKVMAIVACLLAVQSFAQPRDLFAEFEEEAAAADAAAEKKAAEEKKLAEEKAAADKAEADRVAAEKKAAEEKKLAEEKAAADKAEADRVAAEKKAAEEKKLAEEKAAADKAEADRVAAEKKAAEEKKLAEEKAAADKAVADSIAAVNAAEEQARRAAAEKQAAMARSAAIAQNPDSVAAADLAAQKMAAMDSAAAVNQTDPYEGVDRNEMYAREMQRISDSLQYISDSTALAQMEADSIAAVQKAAEDSAKAYADSVQMANASSSSAAPSSSSMSRRDLLGPVKVSKVNGLDEMKGRYKSPRKAMFMSLVIPGSGQMYVGGSNFTYVRGGVYLALEAALWGSWYYFSMYKYDKQVDKYKKFAKEHFSIGRYEVAMKDLSGSGEYNYEINRRYLGSRESFCEAIFGDSKRNGCYDSKGPFAYGATYENMFVRDSKPLGQEMDKVRFDDASTVFQLVSDDAYVLGWDDAKGELADALELSDPNSAIIPLGSSSNQDKYRSLRGKANDYADMQAWFFGGIILNHIVSAVDAALTAHSHNKALYQEDLSWYDHLHFDGGLNLFDGVGVNVQASWGF